MTDIPANAAPVSLRQLPASDSSTNAVMTIAEPRYSHVQSDVPSQAFATGSDSAIALIRCGRRSTGRYVHRGTR